MTLQLTPALEERLDHMAAATHTSPGDLVQRATEFLVAEYEEVAAAVQESDEQFERGQFLTSEEVFSHIQNRFTHL